MLILKRLKPLYAFLVSLIAVALLNAAYLVSIYLQSDPSLPANLNQEAGYELWTLGGLIDFVRRGRFPSGNEILRLSSYELVLSIILVWFVVALLLVLIWSFVSRRLRTLIRPRWLLSVMVVICAVGLIMPPLLAMLPSSSTAHVNINAAITEPLVNQLGFSQGGEVQMQQPGFFRAVAEKLVPLHPTLIRIDHVFDYYNVYQIDNSGNIHYDWSALDTVIDAIFAAGAKPLISLTYLPPALAKDTIYGPPVDLNKWEALIYQTVYHFNVERRLNIEYWEVWNEPNTSSFWAGTLDDYLHLYEASVTGAIRADPSIKIGGPASLSLPPEYALGLPFYEQNWITALVQYTKEHHLPLNFVSWHDYESRPEKFAWSVDLHRSWLEGVQPELLITEWNRNGGRDASLDTDITAAYAINVLSVLSDTPLRAALFFEPFDSSIGQEGYWGTMHVDETPKPVYYAFQLAAQLTGQRLAATSDYPQISVLAAQNGTKTMILLSNIKMSPVSVQIAVTGLRQNASLVVTISGVSIASLGKTNEQTQQDGKWQSSIDMPANSVRLIELISTEEP